MSYFYTFTLFIYCCLCSLQASEPKPYLVYIKPGSILTKISDKSEVKIDKGIYAKVLELSKTKREQFFIYDKEGDAKYIVDSINLVEVSDDIHILPDINAEKTFPVQSIFKTENKLANYHSQINLHFDNLKLSELNNIYNDQISNVLATRYEIRTLYVTNLLFDFGLGLNYQSAYWKNDVEQVKLSILSLGPHFRYNAYTNNDFNLNIVGAGELAPIYQGRSTLYTDKYSAMLYDLGIESEWETFIGKLSIGSHFRHHSIALTESNRSDLQVTPSEFSLNSLGIMIGYKIEWEL